jgi:hypothetical protein
MTDKPPAKPRANRASDAMLDPYASNLPEAPETQGLPSNDLMLEGVRFWTHRVGAYASYFDKLAKCRNFADVGALQATFVTDMQRDYANEIATLAATATLTGLPNFARLDTPLTWTPAAKDEIRQPSVH